MTWVTEYSNTQTLDNPCTQLTWLMCLSLSMIWLMIGSGGLLLRDSELGCNRFRPGPGNLTGQEENTDWFLIV